MRSYKKRTLTFRGQTKSLSEWADEYNVEYNILRKRLYYLGWTVEKALTEPALFKCKSMQSKTKKVDILNESLESIVSNSIRETIWSFKKKKYKALKDNFQKNIPGYLHTHWLRVA